VVVGHLAGGEDDHVLPIPPLTPFVPPQPLRSTAPEEGQSLPMTLSPVLMTDLWKLLGSGCLGDQ
jgi:hypothetical protein